MHNARLDEAQAGIKIAGRNINNLRYADDTTLMAESEEKLKSLYQEWKWKRMKKVGLKLNAQETKIMASWQIDGEIMQTVTDFVFFFGSNITEDGDCNHEIKTLAPWKNSYDKNRQYIIKQRHYFANKIPYSQSYGISSSHMWMWELDHKEDWRAGYLWKVVLEDSWESLGQQG